MLYFILLGLIRIVALHAQLLWLVHLTLPLKTRWVTFFCLVFSSWPCCLCSLAIIILRYPFFFASYLFDMSLATYWALLHGGGVFGILLRVVVDHSVRSFFLHFVYSCSTICITWLLITYFIYLWLACLALNLNILNFIRLLSWILFFSLFIS